MENLIIKEKLQEYLNMGDEKLLKLMYVVAKEYSKTNEEYELTEEQIQEIDRRRILRLKDGSKGYSWNEARNIIVGEKQ